MVNRTQQIMSEASEIKDPAVAVHLARLEGKMENIKQSNDTLGKQLETVIRDLQEVAKVSQGYTAHNESVKRIWEEIDKRDQKWDQRFEILSNGQGHTKDKVHKILYFSAGVSSVAMLLLGVVLWILSGEMEKTTEHDQRLDKIEIHLAGDQLRPYRP
jgi:hypothetical protein